MLVPGLTGPWDPRAAKVVCENLELGSTRLLLSRGSRRVVFEHRRDLWDLACRAFASGSRTQTPWPVAPFTFYADSGHPGSDFWLRMDPVHMKVDFKGATLSDPRSIDITAAEAQRLCDDLNVHFADIGWRIQPAHPARWYVQLAREPKLTCPPPETLVGQALTQMPPFGVDGAPWRAVSTEIQMILHTHEVNRRRLEYGLCELNNVWIWGGGRLPSRQSPVWDLVLGGDERIRGLAAWSGTMAAPLPVDGLDCLAKGSQSDKVLLIFDSLSGLARNGEVEEWRQRLLQLDQHWLKPLLGAVGRREIQRLTVITETAEFRFSRHSFVKYWRRLRSAADCMASR